MKAKTVFFCTECGSESPKWSGRCAVCGAWNSMVEQPAERPAKGGKTPRMNDAVKASAITALQEDEEIRFPTGMGELDRVLGGGAVKGSLVLVGGAPGIGKSTLMLQICQQLGSTCKVLYVSGEESARQLKLRAKRLSVDSENLFVLSETRLGDVLECVRRETPDVLIVDSIQTLSTIGNLLGSGRYDDAVLTQILRSAQENVRKVAALGGFIGLGSDAGAFRVPHVAGALSEEKWLRQTLGEETDTILTAACKQVFAEFSCIIAFELCFQAFYITLYHLFSSFFYSLFLHKATFIF